jgi:glycosyltransferase involved in cell wall biosynthesis
MNVLYVHQYFSTRAGAAGTRSYEFSRAIVKAGHTVTVICGSTGRSQTGLEDAFVDGQRSGTVDGIRVVEFDISYSNKDSILTRAYKFAAFSLNAMRMAWRADYDLLFATSTPLTVVLPGLVARWLRGKPFVFEVRDLWPELPRAMGMRNPFALAAMHILEWAGYKSAHRLVALAPGIRDGIIRLGVSERKIALIPNGCDTELFGDAITPQRQDVLHGMLKDGDFVAIFSGAHGPANGLEAVLDAAAVLKQRGREEIKLLLVGDGKCKPSLQEEATRRGLDNVLFHDPIPKPELAKLLQVVDMGLQILADVAAFYNGTSPNKFFDYIAAGKAVLINYPGWLAQYVSGERCGVVVPPRDPAAFADGLTWASEHRSEVEQMGRKARTLAQREFDRTALAIRFVALLEQTGSGSVT